MIMNKLKKALVMVLALAMGSGRTSHYNRIYAFQALQPVNQQDQSGCS